MGSNPVITIFVIVAALALVVQACVMIGVAMGAAAAEKRITALLKEAQGHIAPVLISTKEILHDAAPKIKTITANVEHISETAKHQTAHVSAVMDDVLRRSQEHINQADAIVGHTLDSVEQTRASVTHVVMQPVKWATAVANGVAAGVQHLMDRKRGGGSGNSVARSDRPWEPATQFSSEPRAQRYRPWEPNPEDLD